MSLKIQNLNFGYPSKVLGKNICLSLNNSELVVLLGPNGVGKSTFLKTLYGQQSALSGEVFYGDYPIKNLTKIELAQKISVLLTEKVYVDYMRVPELLDLAFFAKPGMSRDEKEKKIVEVKDFFGLAYLWDQYFDELSDGQKQRVLLARTALQSMEMLILDEPTTYLDVKGKRELFKLLKRLTVEKGSSILLSTHDLDLAFEYSSKLWVMGCDGVITETTPEAAKTSGIINEVFGL